MSTRLFETWDGDNTTLEEDLARVLEKHGTHADGISLDKLPAFIAKVVTAVEDARGSTAEFTTSMFMLYRETRDHQYTHDESRDSDVEESLRTSGSGRVRSLASIRIIPGGV